MIYDVRVITARELRSIPLFADLEGSMAIAFVHQFLAEKVA